VRRTCGAHWRRLPDAIYSRVQEAAAAAGTTLEQLATEALERDLARRWLERVGREETCGAATSPMRKSQRSWSGPSGDPEISLEGDVRNGRLPLGQIVAGSTWHPTERHPFTETREGATTSS
jgi:hypothetical protein